MPVLEPARTSVGSPLSGAKSTTGATGGGHDEPWAAFEDS